MSSSRISIVLWLLAGLTLVAVGLKVFGIMGHNQSPSPREIVATFHQSIRNTPSVAVQTPAFTDVTAEVGLDFVHDNAANGNYFLPEQIGPGCGFLDYDNDGDLDLFIAGGGAIADGGLPQSSRLYRNDGEQFTDVTVSSGAGMNGPAYGVACVDYDHDNDIDIFVTRYGANVLLRNDGRERFEEIAQAAGVDDSGFGASAVFFDYDRDGWLDLYVTNYVDWSPEKERVCHSVFGTRDYCSPSVYESPAVDRLYRNRGDGTFEDVTGSSGIGAERGQGLGVVAHDFDGDGWEDVYVANDQTPAFLWKNQGDGTFENIAAFAGCAYDGRGIAIAGMGVACEDLDNDQDFDLFVTNIRDQNHLLLQNTASYFNDVSLKLGLGRWSVPATGFGVIVFDQDLDGDLDAYVANGAVNLGLMSANSANPYIEQDHFLRFVDGKFVDASDEIGNLPVEVGRALAAGDIDNDGDLDLLLTNNGGPVRLLRNNYSGTNSWLVVETQVGAKIIVETDGTSFIRAIRPQSSYLSNSDPRAYFGLGSARSINRLTVLWPDGSRHERTNLETNQVITIDRSETQQ